MILENNVNLESRDYVLFGFRLVTSVIIFFSMGIPNLEIIFSGTNHSPMLPFMTFIELVLPVLLLVGMFVRPISLFLIIYFISSLAILPSYSNIIALLLLAPLIILSLTGAGEIALKFKKFTDAV